MNWKILRSIALRHLQAHAEQERPAVTEVNGKHAADEIRRAERIYAYNRRRLTEKKEQIRDRVERIEAEGDPDQKRILPALRGQVEAIRRDEANRAEEHQQKLVELDRLRAVTESFELVSAGLLVPE